MRVLHVNVRLTQGGAGRFAWDLNNRLNKLGIRSRFWYGYASGITNDLHGDGQSDVLRGSNRAVVLANYAAHRFYGREIMTGSRQFLEEEIASADVIHLHAIHHYFLDPFWLLGYLSEVQKPVVVTLHDWWLMTGRCGFPGDCSAWRAACGACGKSGDRTHLPSMLDWSRRRKARKQSLVEALSRNAIFVAPSRHIHSDFNVTYPNARSTIIYNTYDSEFETNMLRSISDKDCSNEPYILVVAADLSYSQKTDPEFIRAVVESTGVRLKTVGANSPFHGPWVENLGYISDRSRMSALIRGATCLIYTSRVDNAPLTLIETLALGTPVVALQSPAAAEILADVASPPVVNVDEAADYVRRVMSQSERERATSRKMQAQAATEKFSPSTCALSYAELYASLSSATPGAYR